jgi:predicted protein tyrosine phosphatase
MIKKAALKIVPVQIVSRYRLDEILENGGKRYSHCISIGDPGEAEPPAIRSAFEKVLRLEFHDINEKSDMPKEECPRPPRKRDIGKIVRFVRGADGSASGFTIHCHAGVHRSVAAGLIAFFLMHGTEASARDELLKVKALPLPNRKMVRLFDRHYGANLSEVTEGLWRRLSDFLAGKLEIDQDDYLDELESAED